MSNYYNEKYLDCYPIPITIEKTEVILKQMKKSICKIRNENGNGTGFFCYIPIKNLYLMITNNHVINEDIINKSNSVNVTLNNDEIILDIRIDDNRKIYTNKEYDVTIIEIKSKEKMEFINFVELDIDKFNQNLNIYNQNIYILQYPKYGEEQKCAVSYGILKEIENNYDLIHLCSTDNGSSGSPILNISNNKIIGIHKASPKDYIDNYNLGTYLKEPINEYLNNINLIKKEILNKNINDKINKKEVVNKSLIKNNKNFDMFCNVNCKHLYPNFSEFFKIFPIKFIEYGYTPFPFETEYGYQFSLLLLESYNICYIKELIEKIIKIPSSKLQLFLGNIKLEKNNEILSDIIKNNKKQLKNEDKFIVKFNKENDISLIIKDNNDFIEISINSMDNVKRLYDLISDKTGKILINYENLKINKQYILKYGNKYLSRMDSMIFEFDFYQNFLTIEEVQNFIYVYFFSEIFLVICKPSEEVENVKSKIADIIGMSGGYQLHLLYGGKVLDSYRSLEDYNVNKGSICHACLSKSGMYNT